MISILYVDDETSFLHLVKGFLEMKGVFTVDTAISAKSALEMAQSHPYEVIVSDYEMPGMNGIELLKNLRQTGNEIPFILFTGRGREDVVIQALNEGADYYLQKDGDPVPLFAELSHKIMHAVEKKQAKIALKHSEEQAQVLIDHIQDGAFLAQDGILLLSNEVQATMLGYQKNEVMGMPISELIAPEDQERVIKRHFDRLAGEILPETYEFNLLHKDRTTRIPVRMSVGIGTYQDRPAVIGTLHNVAKEREQESALEKNEAKYRAIYNNASIGLFTSSLDGRFLGANPYAVKYLGYDSEEDFINSITDIGSRYVDTRDRDKVLQMLTSQGYINNFETRFYRKDGRIIWGLISAKIARKEDGTVVVEGICQDITARKEAEIALQESEKRLKWVYDSGLLGVMFWNLDGQITDANDTFLNMLGYSQEDLKEGRINGFNLTPPEYASVDKSAIEELLETGIHKKPYEKEYIRKDGTRIPVFLAGTMLDEKRTHGVGFVLDITERKKVEDLLYKANKMLTLMTDITRHDLNNQLALIYGNLELAELHTESPSLHEFLQKIRFAADTMKEQITFTKVFQDVGSQMPQWQKLVDVLPYSMIPPYVTIHITTPNIELFADPMLEKVFFNLLDNSLRHGTHVRTITVSSIESENALTILWEDDGIGISLDKKEKIFIRGFGENTGLGLFLVREILAQTSITIHETGEPGKGARFEIMVPWGGYRIFPGSK
jgi:PAS domain S-box-containing protein